MSGKRKALEPDANFGPESMEEINESESGGFRDGRTPDYEEAMTPNYDQRDFDNKKTNS